MHVLARFVTVLLQVFAYLVIRIRLGARLTHHEKNQLLEGLLKLGQNFIETYRDGHQLGTTRVEVSSLGDVCVPDVPLA